jgi:hypothetical protein
MSPAPGRLFDVGEVLINETRDYGTWADWLGIPRHTFSAVFGAVIARGGDYRQVFQYFRPGFDLDVAREARLDAAVILVFHQSLAVWVSLDHHCLYGSLVRISGN